MEWVETTGRTVADALDSALDELGVHEDDVEVEVLEEPKSGFLGRFGSSDARVRVRLKPISREKPGDRRRRKGKGGGRSRGEGSGRGDGPGRGEGKSRGGSKSGEGKPRGEGAKSSSGGRGSGSGSGSENKGGGRNNRSGSRAESPAKGNEMEESTVSVEQQAETAAQFTTGLVAAFGAKGAVTDEIDDGAITVRIDGEDLGLLVGPRGATLNAIEELVRAVVQRETGGHGARIHVDVAGYRAKRREALAGFTQGLVEQVLETGEEKVLEPMQSPDRKVVHDTVAEIDGVETSSEGEEPRRYVVIRRT
jgi:spoIIIJ-associated protein